ncbi:MFS transporter [Thermogemmatispora onikobensis]|uniref:MFS transporter n=1 Tax=Thermogemmatispora onikobensis TaxID=732234 RepID=UPI0009FBBCBD|nr:MFS transporter [Thermogemmatispora onikobensis]
MRVSSEEEVTLSPLAAAREASAATTTTAALQPAPAQSGIFRAFRALRHRNFRLFWFGQLISLIGTWMQTTAQAWLVLELAHDAWLLGVVGALQFLPVLFFALFGGIIADRLPKKRILVLTQSSAAVQAFLLWALVASGTVQIWHVLVLALLLGITNALDMPTRQAFVVEMVGREDLPNAVALNSSLFNMARVLGPAIGGLLIARLGVAPLFLLNALSFVPVIVGITMIDPQRLYAQARLSVGKQGQPGPLQSLREGLAYVAHTPSVLLVIVVVGLVSLFGINFNVSLPLFATDVLHAGPEGFGFISSAFGIGSLLSALWLAWANKRPTIRSLLVSGIAFSALEAGFAISPWYPLSLVLIALTGFTQIAFSALANTTLQAVTPDHLRGRVMSVYMMVFAGSSPIGNLYTGALADLFGAPLAVLAGAIPSLIAALAGWFLREPAEKDLLESRSFFGS